MSDPAALPIYEIRPSLLQSMRGRERVRLVIEAPTGSGKSTQIPRMLLNDRLVADDKEIVVLQPRRIAARMLARRVAFEQGGRLGDEIGYQVRFEKALSSKTRVRFITEGILLRELLNDPQLKHIGAIIFDEFHERHLYGDITLARCLEVQEQSRPDLALIVMSATLETALLRGYLHPCEFLQSEGRTFPVQQWYVAAKGMQEEPWDHAVRALAEALKKDPGDALVFMPGSFEIRKTIEAIKRQPWSKNMDVLPLHGELPPAEQDRAVEPSDRRKIIVSTNVAETSLTIDGVTLVIDSGLARVAAFDASRGINTLTVQPISQASAQQRAGRAGRTSPGLCFRLWKEADHHRRPMAEKPEILRLDVAEVLLTLLASGVVNLSTFRWLDPPEPKAMLGALELLRELGAIDWAGTEAETTFQPTITALGRQLVRYPLHPRHARILEAARDYGAVSTMALVMALLQGRSLFGKAGSAPPQRFIEGDEPSDLIPMLRAWEAARSVKFDRGSCQTLGVNGLAAREAGQLAHQLMRLARAAHDEREDAEENGQAELDAELFGTIMLTGFSDQVGRRTSQGSLACDLPGGRRGQLPKESLVRRSPLIVAAEVREVEGREVQVMLNHVTHIEESWLAALYPQDYRRAVEATWDETQRRVMQKERVTFRDLVLSEKQSGEPDPALAAEILAAKVIKGDLRLTAWDDAVEQWIIRLNCLARWMPELGLPSMSEADRRLVIADMCHGAASYKEIKDASPWQALKSWLSYDHLRLLDKFAPERLPLADGRTGKVTYSETADPTLSARIQQLYGWKETPKIADGRAHLTLTILAPSQRPLQVTKDLAGFWTNHYPKIKSELQRKYPKHEWR